MDTSVTITLRRAPKSPAFIRDGWVAKVKGTNLQVLGMSPADALQSLGERIEDGMEDVA